MTTDVSKLVNSLDCSVLDGPQGPVLMASRVGFSGTHAGEVRIDLRDHQGRIFAVGLMLPEEAARVARAMVDVLKQLAAQPAGEHEVH